MKKPEKTIQRESIILRVLWMLLFLLVWQIAVPLLALLVLAQLLYRLFYGAPSEHFMRFGDSLSQYLAHIGRFAVFNTDAKPWPIADWPQARTADGEAAHIPKSKKTAQAPVSVTPVTGIRPEPVAASEPVVVPEPAVAPEMPEIKATAEAVKTFEVEKVPQASAIESAQTPDQPEIVHASDAAVTQPTQDEPAAKQTKDEVKP